MSERIKIAVCDDESRALAIVSSAISGIFADMGQETVMETFSTPAVFLKRLESQDFDLVFLDISMPKMDGIQLGKAIQSLDHAPDIVFVSSRTDRMFDTFTVEPLGFVRKGHFMEDLNEVLNRFAAKKRKGREGDMVCFQDGKGTLSVDINQVKYIECVRNCQVLYFEDGVSQRKIYSRMATLEEELRSHSFIRVHKGYLINCRFIRCFEAKGVLLTTGDHISIGRSYSQSARSEYLAYISQSGAAYIGNAQSTSPTRQR